MKQQKSKFLAVIGRLTEHLDRLAAAGIHYRKLDAAAK
jgi:hypothetical protein